MFIMIFVHVFALILIHDRCTKLTMLIIGSDITLHKDTYNNCFCMSLNVHHYKKMFPVEVIDLI
jgi:hypothetical protein